MPGFRSCIHIWCIYFQRPEQILVLLTHTEHLIEGGNCDTCDYWCTYDVKGITNSIVYRDMFCGRSALYPISWTDVAPDGLFSEMCITQQNQRTSFQERITALLSSERSLRSPLDFLKCGPWLPRRPMHDSIPLALSPITIIQSQSAKREGRSVPKPRFWCALLCLNHTWHLHGTVMQNITLCKIVSYFNLMNENFGGILIL